LLWQEHLGYDYRWSLGDHYSYFDRRKLFSLRIGTLEEK